MATSGERLQELERLPGVPRRRRGRLARRVRRLTSAAQPLGDLCRLEKPLKGVLCDGHCSDLWQLALASGLTGDSRVEPSKSLRGGVLRFGTPEGMSD